MRIKHTKELQDILDKLDEKIRAVHDFGSADGGCYMLARALHAKISNSKIYGMGMGGTTFHFVVSIGDHTENPFIWDGTKENFLIDNTRIITDNESAIDHYVKTSSMSRLSRRHIEVFDHTQEYGVHPGIIDEDETVEQLIALLPEDIEEIVMRSKESVLKINSTLQDDMATHQQISKQTV